MRKILLCLFISSYVKAQNLVLNSSFEDTIPCITFQNIGTAQLQPTYWYSANGGSPDYYSQFYDSYCSSSPVPINQCGFQYPRTGIAYEGIGTFTEHLLPQYINKREYIGGLLNDSLKQGHVYCVEFYVGIGDKFKYVTDGIGMLISTDSIVDYSILTNLPYNPQISNPSGILLNDTSNWTKISGNFTAVGGEKYFTIGNFKDDTNTLTFIQDSTLATSRSVAYIFIDDVSIVDCTVGIDELHKNFIKGQLYPNPASKIVFYKSPNLTNGELILSDITGKEILQLNLNKHDLVTSIPISNFCKGIYIVSVKKDTQEEVFKLVIN